MSNLRSIRLRRVRRAALPLALATLLACRGEAPPPQEVAEAPAAEATGRQPRTDMVDSLLADLDAVRHPADGGGRAWIEDAAPVPAASPGSWTIRYEAGPLGIAEDGMVFFQVSPFWGWSTPQTLRPEAVGYTEVETTAEGVELVAETLDQQLLGIRVTGRALKAGEQLRIVYGAGEAGARADRFAERESRFWIAVDGDGDGVRKILADSPGVEVLAGPPARLLLHLPSTARPGETVRLTAAILDARGNAGFPWEGVLRLEGEVPGGERPAEIAFRAADQGRRSVELTVGESGVVRLTATAGDLVAESNPLQVSGRGARILWGDLHNHSNLSDGTATPEDLYAYARDVAALDVVALTDHDHWGLLFLDQNPGMWERIRETNLRFHEPGRFVTLLGFEWTSWIHGHRHVLYFGDDGELFSSIDPTWDDPRELWTALRGRRAMTLAHHSAGGPIATDWSIPPDPELEPVTEIVSVHGVSEAADSPSVIYRPVAGNFVRDALERGYRFGFLGSSDGHDGHPGLGHLASPTGGMAAILAEEATREAVYEALKARRVYATSGPRIVLRTSFAGYRMGEDVPLVKTAGATTAAEGGAVAGIPGDTLVVQAIAPGTIERVDVVRSGTFESVLCGEQARECSFSLTLTDLKAGEYLYLRLVQDDGGLAWSSPFYFVELP